MVKSVEKLSRLIFNYLGFEDSALLSAATDIFPEEHQNDGVLWLQYDENGDLSSVIVSAENGKTFLISSERTDFEELSFILNEKVTSPCNLPFEQIDKKYLLHKTTAFDASEKADDLKEITSSESMLYRNAKGLANGAVIRENGEIISEGIVSFCEDYAVITDVFTKEKERRKGRGTALVKKLLSFSKTENVYLICEEKNLEFYENIGFNIVKPVFEYEK